MNYARDNEIIRKHTFMITKKMCVLLCFQSFNLSFAQNTLLTKVIFIQGAFKNIHGVLWKIQGLFKAQAKHAEELLKRANSLPFISK